MKSGTYRFLLRMPEALRAGLAEAAAESGRSLNAELVHRLERSLASTRAEQRLRRRAARTVAHVGATIGAAAIVAGGGLAVGWEAASLALAERTHAATPKPVASPALVARRIHHIAP